MGYIRGRLEEAQSSLWEITFLPLEEPNMGGLRAPLMSHIRGDGAQIAQSQGHNGIVGLFIIEQDRQDLGLTPKERESKTNLVNFLAQPRP